MTEFIMIESIKDLSWHSWCDITLYKDGDKFFVRKTAWRESYNSRLKLQLEKQRSFQAKHLFAPEIYWQWYLGEVFYFDMQYLNCKTLASYMQSITIKEITHLVELALNTLDIQWAKYLSNTNEIFQEKIKSLRNNLETITPIENQALLLLENFNFSGVPYSLCHWDLTLENILITSDKKIYLIDFLDSFFDSWMIDVAKLLQDIELCWSYRYEKMSTNLSLRLTVAKEALLESILELENGETKIKYIYHILLLNVLRIVPYTKDSITKEFLQNALKYLIDILTHNKILSWKL